MPFHIGLLLLPDITQLDMTGPYEVFIKFPNAQVHLVWSKRSPG
jgi:cyclohexyl-isocyanide hydratase